MSHKITVRGNFGSAQSLKDELDARGVSYSESSEGSDTWLTFDGKYTMYGNPLKINLTTPADSHMDADLAHTVGAWYQGAQKRNVEFKLAMRGLSIDSSRVESNGDIVLMVAVG